jgi:hypothetical protein
MPERNNITIVIYRVTLNSTFTSLFLIIKEKQNMVFVVFEVMDLKEPNVDERQSVPYPLKQ